MNSSHGILILGTAQFLSIPCKGLETIIIEHESASAYKMISKPHFDLRVFAEIYASKINAKFIIADEMLRYETIGRKDIDNLIPLHPLSFRIDFPGTIDILSKVSKKEGAKFKIFENDEFNK